MNTLEILSYKPIILSRQKSLFIFARMGKRSVTWL